MSTQLFLRLAASDLGGAGQQALSVTRGAASHTAVTNTTASGTNIQVSKEACDKFGTLLGEFGDLIAGIFDECLTSMKSEEAEEAMKILKDAAVLYGGLAKIGAKHSKADKGKIKQAHDVLSDLDPDCCPANDDDDDEDDEEENEKMVKMTTTLEKVTAERDALTKALTDLVPQITEHTKLVKAMAEDIEAIKNTPMPGPTLRVGTNGEPLYTVLDKGSDMRGGDVQSTDPLDKLASDPNAMAGLAELGIRLAHRNPQHTVPGVQLGRPPGRR